MTGRGFVLPANPPMVALHTLAARALGVGGETTSTSNVLPNPTDTSIPTPTSVFSTPSKSSDLTKTVLEWVFAIAALLVVASLTLWRYAKLRRSNQPLHQFIPRPHSHELRVTTRPSPAPQAQQTEGRSTSHRGRRAAQGADIDAEGRRGGVRDPDDHVSGAPAETEEDKDELPAYDKSSSPPKYLELGLTQVPGVLSPDTLHRVQSHATEDSIVVIEEVPLTIPEPAVLRNTTSPNALPPGYQPEHAEETPAAPPLSTTPETREVQNDQQ
ncbi:hypothetical protein BD410DRAFT_825386 [Rickenella mellea]|uniref:Transmembrane protein n=1 Tax=Rickenella mellea TaxID=50990 RepID=A0A4Y7QHM0_9AGAM|nr:hypothetical protein BD410DRAFT_825386 [Rickenella mellea]